jgi:hypothetical protein
VHVRVAVIPKSAVLFKKGAAAFGIRAAGISGKADLHGIGATHSQRDDVQHHGSRLDLFRLHKPTARELESISHSPLMVFDRRAV